MAQERRYCKRPSRSTHSALTSAHYSGMRAAAARNSAMTEGHGGAAAGVPRAMKRYTEFKINNIGPLAAMPHA
eukprot:5535576-Pyramimonas_sp.AAC.1